MACEIVGSQQSPKNINSTGISVLPPTFLPKTDVLLSTESLIIKVRTLSLKQGTLKHGHYQD